MLINITQEDIIKSETSDLDPITLALRRHFKSDGIVASRDYVKVRKKGKREWVLVPLPKTAKDFLLTVSRYYNPAPFSFKLTDKQIKLIKGSTK